MEQELALGQREIAPGVQEPFSSEELGLLASNGVSVAEIEGFVATSGKQTINGALGGLALLKQGHGQERNEPFSEASQLPSSEPMPS